LLTLAVLSFAMVAAGDSIPDIHIVFDPGPTNVNPINIYQQGVPVSVAWVSCGETGIPGSLSGETACLAMNNLTGSPLPTLDLLFVVPAGSPLVGQTVNCDNTDSFLTSNDCSAAGTLMAGQMVDIMFSGGAPIPNDMDFFIGADAQGLNGPDDFPPVTVTADPTPEPGTLLFFATGLGVLGLGLGWRRKSSSESV
ncbi:MAG: PEP-CTERM sorting domain-containing protein, partial [Terriglobia bacterium]